MLKQDWNPTGEENKGKHQLPLIGQSLFKVQAESVRAEGNRKENKGIKVVYYENLHCLFHFFGEKKKSIVRRFLDWAKTTVLHFASSGRKKKMHLMIRASSVLSGKLCYPLTLHLNEGLLFGFAFFVWKKAPQTGTHCIYTELYFDSGNAKNNWTIQKKS